MTRRRSGDSLTVAYIPSARLEPLITIKVTDDLVTARTEMELGDFSQLPVMRGRKPVGVISWQSIGRALARNPEATLQDCLDVDYPRFRLDDDLLRAIGDVNRHGYVLVVGAREEIVGIVTSADLGEALADLAQPFLYFERLEDNLRRLFDTLRTRGELSSEDVARALPRGAREVSAAAKEFTLGDLVAVLTHATVWDRVTTSFERTAFQRSLTAATAARNKIMHFRELNAADERTIETLPNLVRVSATLVEDLGTVNGDISAE